jgi:hypothetical protein
MSITFYDQDGNILYITPPIQPRYKHDSTTTKTSTSIGDSSSNEVEGFSMNEELSDHSIDL